MWYKLCWQLVYLWDPHVASAGGTKPELGTLGKKKSPYIDMTLVPQT